MEKIIVHSLSVEIVDMFFTCKVEKSILTLCVLMMVVFIIIARDSEERTKWVRSLEETTHYSPKYPSPRRTPPTYPSPTHVMDDAALARKLQEAEAYHQLLSNQSQVRGAQCVILTTLIFTVVIGTIVRVTTE